MKVGLVGLGKMGLNLAMNMMEHGHQVAAYDVNAEAVAGVSAAGGTGVHSLAELVGQLECPRVLWLMVPSGALTENVIAELTPLLSAGDILMDGGNSNYKDSVRRAAQLKERGLHFLDVGTSGGMEGARHGACTMIGGELDVFKTVEPLFNSICVDQGYLYAGPSGSGHFLKMVHNGIEYGMMQSIAEGFEILDKGPYPFDYEQVARVWSNGSVIRSWLMDLTQHAFSEDPKLEALKGVMQSSGEGKWTVEAALEFQTAAPIIALSLMMRYRSMQEDTFSGKVVAALRNQFGGHGVVQHK
ncbi:phosphogluconate dehydrogenase (NAD(+)-dependent, decarboxylating) [Paenibacillus sp. y28]|uniref:phosphogluconate dehydrogenase (NAD(+)-dependent, decarboxylating) n=1 Tax=Paenibacillus sp. y28 TaxID=3129110 RepID=UPI0030192030